MPKNFPSRSIVLSLSVLLIALSLVLVVTAMSIRDFGQPGQEALFTGRSSWLLVAAFAMLAGLVLFLLIAFFRAARTSVSGVVPMPFQSQEKRTKMNVTAASPHKTAERTEPDQASAQLLSETAGELRTSVDVIQEELEEIIEDDLPADKEQMQSLYQETDRLKKIIDGMEQLSQAQALARSLKKESLQVEPLLSIIIEKTRAAVTDRDVTYNLECEAGLDMTADPACLSSIIENIADNAARSIKESGSVTLTAARKGDQVVFSVRDTGAGIRRSHRSHIYERFFRGTGNGVGLGLSIVKELVDACGGKIEVQTETGKGTTFTVQIPAE